MALLPIQILGTSFSLKTDEDPEHLLEVIEAFRRRVDETRQLVPLNDPLKLAILAGIILTDELLKERAKPSSGLSQAEADEFEKITQSLISRIDNVLG